MRKLSCIWQSKEIPKPFKDLMRGQQWKMEYSIEPLEKIPTICGEPQEFMEMPWGYRKNDIEIITIGHTKVYHSHASRMPFRNHRAIYLFDSYYQWDQKKIPIRYRRERYKLNYGLGIIVDNCIVPIVSSSLDGISGPCTIQFDDVSTWLDYQKPIKEVIELMKQCTFRKNEWSGNQITQKVFVKGYKESDLHEYTPYHYNLFNTMAQ